MSKPVAPRGSVSAFCIVPALAMVAAALLAISPAVPSGSVSTASAGSFAPSLASQTGTGAAAARGRIQASYAALPLAFEQNQGQTDAQVKYLARGNGYTLFLTATDAVFSLHSPSAQTGSSQNSSSALRRGVELRGKRARQQTAQKNSTAVVRMQLADGNSLAKVAASGLLAGKSNYFIGNDASQWRTNVAHYARVSYQDVYPGVNLAYHGAQSQLEFDFVVAPGANPAPIAFNFTGANVKTDDSGNLIISSAAGNVLLHKPVAYQEQHGARQAVEARFALKANTQVSFELGNYDRSRELVIDPAVSYEYSTYLGGSQDDEGYGIAFDNSGNAYVTGQTASANFPTVGGVLPNSIIGTANVFVTKVAADGSSLIYSTYIGGTGPTGDSGNAIAVNPTSGVAYVAGGTDSINFPHTTGAFQTTLGAGAVSNAFLFELNAAGNALTYSTFLGGTGNDVATGIAVDGSGNIYTAGFTSSTDFPTKNPLQTYPGTPDDGFVSKLTPAGNGHNDLVYSTYLALGGLDEDTVNALALDSNNNVYVTGVTSGTALHTTNNAFQKNCGCGTGTSNAFVTVINQTGTGYVYSTYLGGTGTDNGDGIAVDSSGDAYVTGSTESSNFPLQSPLPGQGTYSGGTDAFVTELNPTGTALVYSTYLGGSGQDTGASIAVDSGNNAYIAGQTSSTNFPTASPTQSANGGGFDAFVSEIVAGGSQLVFSTYLGGTMDEDDGGDFGSIAVDGPGANIYVTGNTASSGTPGGFPTTNAVQTSNGGNNDAFVVKYAQLPSFTISATPPASVAPGSSGMSTVTLTSVHGYSSIANSHIVIWNPPSPTTTQTSASGQATFAPMAAGSANPIVPNPPDVISVRGCSCL